MCNCTSGNLEIPGLVRSLSSGTHSRDPLGPARNDPFGSIQIDVELIGAVAADQRQFEGCSLGVDARRHAIEFKGKALDAGRAMLEKFWNRQSPVRGRAFDKQI